MFRAWRGVRTVIMGLVVASCAAPAFAVDPFTLFLLRMLRDQTISSSIETGVAASQQSPGTEGTAPATPFGAIQPTSESLQLKATIDDSFLHLGPRQREELHASLMQILNDPKNSSSRAAILAEFNGQAQALRNSHRMLSRLSESDMRIVATEARSEYERLPADERQLLLSALQRGVPGMPRALQDMMLAEFGSVPAAR